MGNLLFINCCPRKREESRTLALCDTFLKMYHANHPEETVTETCLFDQHLHSYSMEEINHRNALISQKEFHHEMFSHARQFAEADRILIGAPYWDLSFPSMMKIYVEHICVNGITFHYTEDGAKGLSNFEWLLYITTSGGYLVGKDFGSQYLRSISGFLGNGKYLDFSAQGLDIKENSPEQIVQDAKTRLVKIFRNL